MEIKQVDEYILKALEQFNNENNHNLTYSDLFRFDDKINNEFSEPEYRSRVFLKANNLYKNFKAQLGTPADEEERINFEKSAIGRVAERVAASLEIKDATVFVPEYEKANKSLNYLSDKFVQIKTTDKIEELKTKFFNLLYKNFMEHIKEFDEYDFISFNTKDEPKHIEDKENGIEIISYYENKKHLEIFVKGRSQHSDFFPTEINLTTIRELQDITDLVLNKYETAKKLEGKLDPFEKVLFIDKQIKRNKNTF